MNRRHGSPIVKSTHFLAGLAPAIALVSCASPKAVVVNEKTLKPVLPVSIVWVPIGNPAIQPGSSSPPAPVRPGSASAVTVAAPALVPAGPTEKRPGAVPAPTPQGMKPVAGNEQPLPTFEPLPPAAKAGGNDGLRLPNMLELPKDDELRSKKTKGKGAPDGGPVISRPPTGADKKKSE